jgi:predicted MPP superfamily phosphohydrolase
MECFLTNKSFHEIFSIFNIISQNIKQIAYLRKNLLAFVILILSVFSSCSKDDVADYSQLESFMGTAQRELQVHFVSDEHLVWTRFKNTQGGHPALYSTTLRKENIFRHSNALTAYRESETTFKTFDDGSAINYREAAHENAQRHW